MQVGVGRRVQVRVEGRSKEWKLDLVGMSSESQRRRSLGLWSGRRVCRGRRESNIKKKVGGGG